MAFCCFVGGSVLVYPRYCNQMLSSMLHDRSWRGSGLWFALKTSATLSKASWHVSLARFFSPLRESSRYRMAWAKAPSRRTRSSCLNLWRNLLCWSSMLVRNLTQQIHARSSLEFVPDVLALSQESRAYASLSTR